MAETEACDADLTIISLSEGPQVRGSFDGKILERLLMTRARPSIVVKSRQTRRYESVLVGLDLSPTSRHAFEAALGVPNAPYATVVSVFDARADIIFRY